MHAPVLDLTDADFWDVYTINGFDAAGNKAVETVSIIPAAKLYSPARGATVTSPPLLAWREVTSASCYNLQVYFGVLSNAMRRVASVTVSGRKVLSAWPLKPQPAGLHDYVNRADVILARAPVLQTSRLESRAVPVSWPATLASAFSFS